MICALTIILPISTGGLRATTDLPVHLAFAQAYKSAFLNGDLFPGWANDNLGFGSIGIRFYPPITAYCTVLFETISGSWYLALWISLFGWMVLGCYGVYLFVKEWSAPVHAVIAGILYSLAPYHLAQIYRFFLYAEFAAAAILPFCFLFVTRICRRRSRADVAAFAVSYSLVVLSHIPTAIILTLCLLVYVAILAERKHLRKTVLLLLSSGVLAVLATGSFWVRLVTELQWVAHADAGYSTGAYSYSHFLFPNVFAVEALPIWVSILRHLDVMITLTALMLIPFAAVHVTKRKSENSPAAPVNIAIGLTAGFALLMLSKPSEFIWSRFSLLQKIQFPWRWLTVLSMLAVVSFVLSIGPLFKGTKTLERIITYCALFLLVLITVYDVRQIATSSPRIAKSEFKKRVEGRLISGPAQKQWWPNWAKETAFEEKVAVIAAGRSVEISGWQSEKREFTLGEGVPANIRVATFYYPYWRASVNGRSVEVNNDENGTITFPVEGERSEIELHFEEPFLQTFAQWLSVGTWSLLLLALCSHAARSMICYQNKKQ